MIYWLLSTNVNAMVATDLSRLRRASARARESPYLTQWGECPQKKALNRGCITKGGGCFKFASPSTLLWFCQYKSFDADYANKNCEFCQGLLHILPKQTTLIIHDRGVRSWGWVNFLGGGRFLVGWEGVQYEKGGKSWPGNFLAAFGSIHIVLTAPHLA